MDLNEFRSFVIDSGIDVWTWINMAISMASADYENELKNRRDGIIEKLYSPAFSRCQNCDHQFVEGAKCNFEENGKYLENGEVGCDYNSELLVEEKMVDSEEEEDGDDDEDDEEQRRVLEIKILLDDQSQDETCLISLLQRLEDMDITFKVLKETDIGRHVTRLRKHSSSEVRRLVKILVRKWKDTVDEWVRMNTPTEEVAQCNGKSDEESSHQSEHDNIKKGETEVLHGKDEPNTHAPYYVTPQKGKVKDKQTESPDDYSTTKRLHGSFQEAQNGHSKKQRRGQETGIHHTPKTNNVLVTSNRGSVPVKYW